MKICAVCKNIYNEDMQFCTVDGVVLINRESLEQETITFPRKPTSNNILQPTMPFLLPKSAPSAPIYTKPNRISVNIFIILIAVIFISSVSITLTTIGFANFKTANVVNKPSTEDLPKTSGSDTLEKKRTNETVVTNPAETVEGAKKILKGSNARVIMLNAIIRSAPTMEAEEQEIVRLDEPLIIGKKASQNSPWFRVTTASGGQGWIHGNMFEFTE